ncbi:sugar-binding transcriptional regulator [Pseudogracilibacillus auburnensis]|uniref:Deoxyribonucleoside regulator n=1 Tax=Pseudogracilibacillus auburnensis TaxID=1494959 RepID=A0A2V3VUE5_9BACI|nr:sugar-binding transcriptional regulator [Pseudogracilibacillus auburnensis]PXW85527.1 deoxyribonucleoside regulator [Pseudogracilibacillus auburnensis]
MHRVVKVAKLYYQLDYSQQEIAKELGISRPSVSRLLQEAKEKGVVEIKINDINEKEQKNAELIKERFGLKECMIVNAPKNDDFIIKKYLGSKGAEYLSEIVTEGDIIGLTWGTTIFEVAKNMTPKQVHNVQVVQLNGGVSHSETNTFASEIINYLGASFHTIPYFLPLPAIVERAEIKQMIVSDRHISSLLKLARKANIALFTVGDRHEDSTLNKAGYFNEVDMQTLKDKKAVGDICSRFFTINGEVCSEELNARTIGIDLHLLGEKETSVLIAGGSRKFNSIVGALNGAYANVLITDNYTAEALIEKFT